jgi:hypothetical protein
VKVVDDLLSDEIKKGRQSHHQEEEVAEVEVEQKALVMTEERGVSRRRRRRRKMRMRRGCDENSFETQEWNHKRQVWKRISYSRTIDQQSQRRI